MTDAAEHEALARPLDSHQHAIVHLICQGIPARLVADELGLPYHSVLTVLADLRACWDAPTNCALAAQAVRRGYVT